MLIIGTMNWTSTRERGGFFCPECSIDRNFRRRASRPFLTLYFIPVIPIGGLSEFIECESCRLQFDDDVLRLTAEDYQRFLATEEFDHIKRAMILMMLADDIVDEEEIEVIRDICEEALEHPVSKDELVHEANLARQAHSDLIGYVKHIQSEMTNLCKDQLVRACFMVATAKDGLDELKQELLEQLPTALEMSENRFRAAIEMAVG